MNEWEIQETMRETLSLLYQEGDVVELRIVGVNGAGTISGYFDDFDKLTMYADRFDSRGYVYVVLNPVDPVLTARCYNKVEKYTKYTTKDKEVLRRRWLFIDCDAVRPEGISSTNEEHEATLDKAHEIASWLREEKGFPDMVIADSGNGAHILIAVDFPNDEEVNKLFKKFLGVIKERFETGHVKIDTTVYNAARLIKLWGTKAIKGEDSSDRPHRYSRLLHVPKEIMLVSKEDIEEVASLGLESEKQASTKSKNSTGSHFDLKAFIENHDIAIAKIEETEEGTRYHLEACPFNPEHEYPDSALVQFENGAIGFHCFHDSCSDKKWRDVRMLYEGEDDELEKACAACERSDLGNGYRLILRYGHTLFYVAAKDTWYIWNGRYWRPDIEGQALDTAGKTAELIKGAEAATIPPDFRDNGTPDFSERDTHKAFGKLSENVGKRKSMLTSAGCDERIRRLPTDWDVDPWLLNVANGTIELGNNGLLRPHNPKDMITRMVDVAYDPEAKCPLWTSFLKRVLPNAEERRFVRKYIGYCLTSITTEQCFLVIYGHGQNGKSVLVKTVQALLASYRFHASAKAVMQTERPKEDYTVAELPGVRLLTLDEVDERDILNEALIKNMTGGDEVACRSPFHRPFSFVPQFKLILYGNHKPRIIGTDDGIWRRPKLLHFAQTIPKSERDPHLTDKLKEELPGILAWAVRGCLLWQEEGLEEPDSMSLALQHYRSEMDTFQQFVDECITATGDEKDIVGSQYMYDHYKYWCERSGHRAFAITKFVSRMRDRGFKKSDHTKKGSFWIGLEIQSLEEDYETPARLRY